jgi:hypothetical protein
VKIKLAYGREGLEIDLPDGLNVDVVRPEHMDGLPDQKAAIEDALLRPIHALICLRAEVYFHSHNLSDRQIEGAFFRPCSSVEGTLDELLHKHGRGASICVLPEGPQVVPYVSQPDD